MKFNKKILCYLIPLFIFIACNKDQTALLNNSAESSNSNPQLSVGLQYSCILNAAQEVKCWGYNNYGQLGYDDTTTRGSIAGSITSLTPINLGQKVKQIATGFSHACALLEDNSVRCWGRNSSGQLGYDDTTDRGNTSGSMAALSAVNLGQAAKKISAGGYTTCAILLDDTVKCWGYNGNGELGQDDTANRGHTAGSMAALNTINLGQIVKDISVGGDHVCSILSDDSLKCWGRNLSGELGYEDNSPRGKTAGSMAALGIVNLGQTVKQVHTKNRHTCVVLLDNTAKCWGANWEGALGQDSTSDIGTSAGSITTLPAINLGQTVKSIQTGYEHTCAILADDSLKCWGYNWDGVLGIGSQIDQGDQAGSMAGLGFVNIGQAVKAVSLGEQHTCALLANDSVKCWGYNGDGRLGYEDTVQRGTTAGSMTSLTEIHF